MRTLAQRTLPYCTLRLAVCSGASSSRTVTPKLVGFHRCRPLTRRAYFDAMEIMAHSTNGHNSGDLMRMPALMPVT